MHKDEEATRPDRFAGHAGYGGLRVLRGQTGRKAPSSLKVENCCCMRRLFLLEDDRLR